MYLIEAQFVPKIIEYLQLILKIYIFGSIYNFFFVFLRSFCDFKNNHLSFSINLGFEETWYVVGKNVYETDYTNQNTVFP